MDAQKFDALLDKLKLKLNITWFDVDTEARLSDVLDNGLAAMRHKLGLADDYDFQEPGQELNLLLSWCLYEWNHSVSEFDANYANDILQCRQKQEVKAYAAEADTVQ